MKRSLGDIRCGAVSPWQASDWPANAAALTVLRAGEVVFPSSVNGIASADNDTVRRIGAVIDRLGGEGGAVEAVAKAGCEHSFGFRDVRSGHTVCVRDLCGVEPLYYVSRPGDFFAFASEIEPLLALPRVQCRLNRLKAALHLSGPGVNALDASMTFFEDMHRLPPGHSLIATPRGVTVHRYVSFEQGEAFRGASDAELSEELLMRLRRAVRKGADKAGLLLGGGLKSAAIAALACEDRSMRNKLPCWTFWPEDVPGWTWPDDPRPQVDALSHQLPLQVHRVGWKGSRLERGEDYYPEIRERPVWFYLREDEAEAMAGAEQAGLSALITGMGGQWLPIFRPPHPLGWSAMRDGGWRSLFVDRERQKHRPVREIGRLVRDHLLASLLPAIGSTRAPDRRRDRRSLLRESFAAETGLAEWVRDRVATLSRDFRENAYREMAHGGLQLHLENWAMLGRAHGLEFRYPLLDREVVDFCWRLPASYYLKGESQRVMREAMRGRLPETIRTRKRRLAAIVDWPYRKVQLHPRQRSRLVELQRHPALSAMVDLAPIHQVLDQFPTESALRRAMMSGGLKAAADLVTPGGIPTTVEYYWSFARFLDRNGFR